MTFTHKWQSPPDPQSCDSPLPESIRFLVRRGGRDAEVRRLATALRPDLLFDATTRFVMKSANPTLGRSGSPLKLFSGGLAVITPLLWVMIAANQFTNFFAVSWLPTLLQSVGSTTAEAGINASLFPAGGLVGGFVLMFLVDRFGALPLVVLFLLGAPMIAIIGFAHSSPLLLWLLIASAGFCVTGNNFGFNALLGLIYPTEIRSNGAGWAQAIGRVGALGAQFVGAAILARHGPIRDVFLAPAMSLVLGAVAAGIFVVLCFRRFGGYRLDEVGAGSAMANRNLGTRFNPSRPLSDADS